MKNKTSQGAVLITGTSTGIGKACALELDKMGFRVFAGVRKEKDGESLMQAASGNLTPVSLDVSDYQQISAAFALVSQSVGDAGLAGLVNNAGIGVFMPVEFVTSQALRLQYEINVFGVVEVTKAFLPLIRKARGRIVNISSAEGKMTLPLLGPLASSKHALESISDALRMELYPWGIHVSVIEPGWVKSAANEKIKTDGEAFLEKLSPEGKGLYGEKYKNFMDVAMENLKKPGAATPAEDIAIKVVHALTARRPKTRYVVGNLAKQMMMMKKWLPDRLSDRLFIRAVGMSAKFGSMT